MNILMTTDTIGGVWHYCLDLIRAFGEYQINVDLATMGRPLNHTQLKEVEKIPNLRVHQSSYKLEWMNECWEDVDAAGQWLQHLAQKLQPDVIHFNHFCSAHLEFGQPKLVVAHSDVISWWRHVHKTEAPASWNLYRNRVSQGLSSADLVIAPTRAMLNGARNDFGRFRRSKVIPNGRSLLPYKNLKEPFVLSIGRIWDQAKNISMLDEIAPKIAWPIVGIGKVDEAGVGKAAISNLNIIGECSPDTVSNYLSKAAIYALPAKYEPFGLSILEAAMHECALVLGDIPSLRENWDGAALFVDPHNKNELMNALDTLISDASLRIEFGKRALERAEKFSIERTAADYVSEYRHLLKSRLYASQDQYLAVSL